MDNEHRTLPDPYDVDNFRDAFRLILELLREEFCGEGIAHIIFGDLTRLGRCTIGVPLVLAVYVFVIFYVIPTLFWQVVKKKCSNGMSEPAHFRTLSQHKKKRGTAIPGKPKVME